MSQVGVPLARLYTFCSACALFAAAYGALELNRTPAMTFLLFWGPSFAVTWWLAADSKRTRVIGAYDAGLLFYLTWPVTLPWYTWRSRGAAGWALAAKLYGLALAGQLGYLVGATLRFFLSSPGGTAV
jgi:hypothetical protein